MDEISWRVRLAKSNINILNTDGRRWYYEFMYHPKPGQTKWCKTYFDVPSDVVDESAWALQEQVFKLRRELEA